MGAGGHYRYVKRKNGEELYEIPEPLIPVLSDTYSVHCFHWSTMVSLADGREIMAKDVKNGDLLHTVDQSTRTVVARRCRGCVPTRRDDGLRIGLSNGESVILTRDHQVLTPSGMARSDSLSLGDLVATARHSRSVGPKSFGMASWLGNDEDVAYLLGQLTGDGCLTSDGVSLCTGEEAAHKAVLERLREVFPKLKLSPYWHCRSWYIGISCSELSDLGGNRKTKWHVLLEELGMKKRAIIKRIPDIMKIASREAQRAFMAGLFDADGTLRVVDGRATRCSITSGSIGLLRDIAAFLRAEGIPYTFYENKVMMWDIATFLEILRPWLVVKRHDGLAYDGATVGFVHRAEVRAAWKLSGETQCGFCDVRGMARSVLTTKRQSNCDSRTAKRAGIDLGDLLYHSIVSIDPVYDQQFYGLSVEEHHNFIGNGVVLKNCFQEQIMEIFQVLCGYSAAEADEVRKEIDKLNRGKSGEGRRRLAARKDEFISKASEKIGGDAASSLWTEIIPYTGYSFNRPHSAGYS